MGNASTAEVRVASPVEFQPELIQDYLETRDESGLASPVLVANLGTGAALSQVRVAGLTAEANSQHSQQRASRVAELESEALSLFTKPFRFVFASLFKKDSEITTEKAPAAEEVGNPFSQAKSEIADTQSNTKTQPSTEPEKKTAHAQTEADTPKAEVVGSGTPIEGRFAFIGDFDGSGLLKINSAERIEDTTFGFGETTGVFSLYLNPSAVEAQRSFGIDDVDGDGKFDLLATSRASLFGGILLGNGQGSFHVAGSFVTGYEPVVATVGLGRDLSTSQVHS